MQDGQHQFVEHRPGQRADHGGEQAGQADQAVFGNQVEEQDDQAAGQKGR